MGIVLNYHQGTGGFQTWNILLKVISSCSFNDFWLLEPSDSHYGVTWRRNFELFWKDHWSPIFTVIENAFILRTSINFLGKWKWGIFRANGPCGVNSTTCWSHTGEPSVSTWERGKRNLRNCEHHFQGTVIISVDFL